MMSQRFFSQHLNVNVSILSSTVVSLCWSFKRKTYTWWSPKISHSWNPVDFVWISPEIWWISGEIHQISCRFHEIHWISKDQLPVMVSPMFWNRDPIKETDNFFLAIIHGWPRYKQEPYNANNDDVSCLAFMHNGSKRHQFYLAELVIVSLKNSVFQHMLSFYLFRDWL